MLTSDAQETTPYKFEFKSDAKIVRKDFVYADV
jgi:hypothetical protein